MRLALDATYSADRTPTGVGVYSREILHGLARAHPEASWLWCYRSHRLLRSFAGQLPARCSRRLLLDTRPPRADLFHGLNQRLPETRPRRAVVTFHDLFVLTGNYSTPEFRARFARQARDAADRADRIIAVSNFTARQVNELLGVERNRIRVVHHGVRIPAAPVALPREPLVLSVGAIQLRKNTRALVEAFERMPEGWRLVLAGSPSGYEGMDAMARIEASPRRGAIATPGYVDPEELERLYARASIFAFPSLDEGFGIPVLEAMARGLPVLTSNRSALPEVAGDAALLVNPDDVTEIAAGLTRLAGDAGLRDRLAALGIARAGQFRWEDAVEQTWSVYEELLR